MGSNLEVEHIVLDLVDRFVNEEQFIKLGFNIFDESWGILMVKDLKEDHSVKEIRKIYGIDDSNFHMTVMDEY